ncbi:SET domain-containing protein 5 [Podospora aff. communis PSN243]|uniref:SET domain-containing protein 5 n=1 Tax=Podospora aff. communis PSN243 TaxID=3040156 RepID=A0AAV9GJV9_9PEZI|nr:SET domain-containing protein 5 [Podospora aff. communis PSN243]
MPFTFSRQFQAVALGCAFFFSRNGVWAAAENLGGSQQQQCRWNLAGPLAWREKGVDTCGRPVDDKAAGQRIWSYTPACAHPESGEGAPYCVYSYKENRGGSGLSVLATPEVAADIEGFLGDPNPTWLHSQAQRYYQDPQLENRAFEVRDVPGKGKGAIATRLIRAGEVLIRESPAILNIPQLPKGVLPAQVGGMFELAVKQLPERQQKRVVGLSRGDADDGGVDMSGDAINRVLNTNSFGIHVKDHFMAALCPDIARINHACRPNMFTRFSHETFTMEAVAYADIQSGEELHLSYLPLNLLSEDRKAMIQQWGFNCTCSLCSSPDKASESDRNKRRIQEILDQLQEESNRTPEKVETFAQELFKLLDAERLMFEAGNFASLLTGVYYSMGEMKKARQVASTAVSNNTLYLGHDSVKVQSAKELVEMLAAMDWS